MDFTKKDTYTYNGEAIEYHYSSTATYAEQSAVVSVVSDMVFVKGNYLPLLKDIAFDFVLLSNFTDVDFVGMGINDVDAFAEFDKATGIAKKVKSSLNPTMVKTLAASVDANIEYKRQTVQDNISTAVVELIKTLTDKVATFGDDIDTDMVMDFVQKFNESGFDSESIAEAYFNSDVFKQNVEQVTDKKNAEIRELRQKLNDATAKNVVADKPVTDNSKIEVVPKDK